jgi:RluA family pseudouridine synthase
MEMNVKKELVVEAIEDGLTVMEFLQRRIPAAPQGYLRQLLKKGKVTSAFGTLAAKDLLTSLAVVSLPDSGRLRELMAVDLPDPASTIEILFESRELLVVNKPPGLAVHSSVGHENDNLTDRVAALLAQRGDQFSVAPVHRLDLETSGPVMFGKGRQACARFGALFIKNEMEKCYLALVAGKSPGSGILYSTLTAKGKEKEASSSFKALDRTDSASLLEVCLYTGRQHQIRRQLSALGHPVFGDSRYGGPCPQEVPRLFLHCSRISFVDPFSGAAMTVEAPLPADLSSVLVHSGLNI